MALPKINVFLYSSLTHSQLIIGRIEAIVVVQFLLKFLKPVKPVKDYDLCC